MQWWATYLEGTQPYEDGISTAEVQLELLLARHMNHNNRVPLFYYEWESEKNEIPLLSDVTRDLEKSEILIDIFTFFFFFLKPVLEQGLLSLQKKHFQEDQTTACHSLNVS